MNLNVVLQPIAELQRAVIAMSQQVGAETETHFVLDGEAFHPHMTVYKATVDDFRLADVIAVVARLAVRPEFHCPFVRVGSGRGYILLRFECAPGLMALHREVVEAVNPLRAANATGVHTKYALTSQQGANNLRYGHPRVLDTFEPHMTVTRLPKASDADRVAGQLEWNHSPFCPCALSVFRSGDHGTCRALLHAAPLQAS